MNDLQWSFTNNVQFGSVIKAIMHIDDKYIKNIQNEKICYNDAQQDGVIFITL